MADPKLASRQIPPYIGRLLWNDKAVGTGFIVHESGLIATCYHVAAVPCKSDNDSPVGETFTFELLRSGLKVEATVTKKLDRENDVALLKADPFADKKAVARLISSENVTAGTAWRTIGFGDIEDPGHEYHYLPATGSIDGVVSRDQVKLLKLQSSGILQGMSGGPVVVDTLGGVVGLVSARYMIDPTTQTFLRDTGWASRIDTLVALDKEVLKLQAPVIPRSPNRLPLLMALLVAILLAGSVIGLVYNFIGPKPPDLPLFPFKVAIAGFTADLTTGATDSDAQTLSQTFYNNFNNGLPAEIKSIVTVWSPNEIAKVGTIQGATEDKRSDSAAALAYTLKTTYHAAADIIVYGMVTKTTSGKYSVKPEFYVTDNWPDLSEIYGRYALDPAVSPSGEGQIVALSIPLAERATVMSYIAEGIAEMTLQRYQQAHVVFANTLTKLPNNGGLGQQLVQVLMANASLGDYNRISAVGPDTDRAKLPELLTQAHDSFQAAFNASKGNYARAMVGLAGTLYLNAVNSVAARDAWNDIDPQTLTTIEATYNQALTVSDIPASADISTKVHFGLGQVAVLRDLRHEKDAEATGKKELSQVIADYGNGKNPRVQELAAQAYGARASLEANSGDFKMALADYSQAISLTQLDSRAEVFKNAVAYVNFTERIAANDLSGTAKAAEEYLKLNISATDAAKTLYRLGKTYIEAGISQTDDKAASQLREKGVTAYERGATEYLTADPAVIADLWHELGDKYYDPDKIMYADPGNIPRSTLAYARAIYYDPKTYVYLLNKGIGPNLSDLWNDFIKEFTITQDTTLTTPSLAPTTRPILPPAESPTESPTLAGTQPTSSRG